MSVKYDGVKCTCGRLGCWESYSSATGLIREAREAAIENPDSLLSEFVDGNLELIDAKVPFDAAQAGDEVARNIINEYVLRLAVGLTNVICILSPQVIIVGGGISLQKDNLLLPLKKCMKREDVSGNQILRLRTKHLS